MAAIDTTVVDTRAYSAGRGSAQTEDGGSCPDG